MALDLERTLSGLMDEGLTLLAAHEATSRALRQSFNYELLQGGYATAPAERHVTKLTGISPFFSEIPTTYETALEHLRRIANAQRSYLDGTETTHETRSVRRSAQGADIVTI